MSDNDLTKVHIDLPNHWATGGESMWARHLGDDLYEIDNIPFYAYGVNYRDVVLATADEPNLKPEVRKVATPSGHRTLRIIFLDKVSRAEQEPHLDKIVNLGATVERANDAYLAIDVAPTFSYDDVLDLIQDLEDGEILGYETCEPRVEGSFDAAAGEDDE